MHSMRRLLIQLLVLLRWWFVALFIMSCKASFTCTAFWWATLESNQKSQRPRIYSPVLLAVSASSPHSLLLSYRWKVLREHRYLGPNHRGRTLCVLLVSGLFARNTTAHRLPHLAMMDFAICRKVLLFEIAIFVQISCFDFDHMPLIMKLVMPL